MKALHTPEPWTVTGQETERYTSTIRHIDETTGQRKELWIADCTKHDAKLISAAPELLEACKFVMKYHNMRLEKGDDNELPLQLADTVERAIAKATGQ